MVINDEIFDIQEAEACAGLRLPEFNEWGDLLTDWEKNFDLLQEIAEKIGALEGGVPIVSVRPLPPLGRPRKMLFAAANYKEHAAGMRQTFTPIIDVAAQAEEARARPVPYMFAKACEPTGAFDDIIIPAGAERVDWEAELMVVIGKPSRFTKTSDVGQHIAGYMTANDVSCRDRTWRLDKPALRSDWLTGKSYETFAPIGPFFTPKAFVPDHGDMRLQLWVNGDLKQDGNTADMIFSVEEQIEYLSQIVTLLPGDVIATGTPAGTGQERGEFLREGDVVEAEVQGCGRQRNRVKAEATSVDGRQSNAGRSASFHATSL